MRLRSVFKMRTSILNTATTEQMGCILFFFFRLHEMYKSVVIVLVHGRVLLLTQRLHLLLSESVLLSYSSAVHLFLLMHIQCSGRVRWCRTCCEWQVTYKRCDNCNSRYSKSCADRNKYRIQSIEDLEWYNVNDDNAQKKHDNVNVS